MDDWALWEEENCWKAEDDWRLRDAREQQLEREKVFMAEYEISRRALERYLRRGKDGDDNPGGS